MIRIRPEAAATTVEPYNAGEPILPERVRVGKSAAKLEKLEQEVSACRALVNGVRERQDHERQACLQLAADSRNVCQRLSGEVRRVDQGLRVLEEMDLGTENAKLRDRLASLEEMDLGTENEKLRERLASLESESADQKSLLRRLDQALLAEKRRIDRRLGWLGRVVAGLSMGAVAALLVKLSDPGFDPVHSFYL